MAVGDGLAGKFAGDAMKLTFAEKAADLSHDRLSSAMTVASTSVGSTAGLVNTCAFASYNLPDN